MTLLTTLNLKHFKHIGFMLERPNFMEATERSHQMSRIISLCFSKRIYSIPSTPIQLPIYRVYGFKVLCNIVCYPLVKLLALNLISYSSIQDCLSLLSVGLESGFKSFRYFLVAVSTYRPCIIPRNAPNGVTR